MTESAEPIPPRRLLMGPGPVDADPRVLRAMAMPLLGQFDPAFTAAMTETMALYRGVFQTANRWTFLVDGTARAGIEAVLVSVLEPGDRMLVPIFGRFGHLLCEIGRRVGATVDAIETEWGGVFLPEAIEDAIRRVRPKLLACVHGDTSTTMAQPLAEIGAICRRHDVLLYVDATATLGGVDLPVDAWSIDACTAGLQKCLSGPPGSAPLTLNDRLADRIARRRHIEQGLRDPDAPAGDGPVIASNYFDLAMLMEYWSDKRLNHHTEATTMLYAARECARIALAEGLDRRFARHRRTSEALVAGLAAMGLRVFGDAAHKMANVTGVHIPAGVDGEAVRHDLLTQFGIEIGTSFGPLHGKIWRIGTMGYTSTRECVAMCLVALDAVLRRRGYGAPPNAGLDAALAVYAGA
ncbi:MAG: alanine--glyoxylate aminotransferase family protein [Alphaproteobacteria bacterium]|nr:alanine--glyoxylate aminotransferase family protein [Alphaproteobacteria bacterium]